MATNLRHRIRPATPDDHPAMVALAVASELFQPQEAETLDRMLSEYFDGNLDDHHWVVMEADGVVGAAYFAPELMADGTWNLYFIAILPETQGRGLGAALLANVENALRDRGARLLLVETSGKDDFQRTRAFYAKNGYHEEARIRDFYRAGDDKVVFRKAL